MNADQIIDQPTTIATSEAPTVSRWDTDDAGPVYLVEFTGERVSVRLGEEQIRQLGARILWSTITSDDELEAMCAADDDTA
jgi:hypothetical protein